MRLDPKILFLGDKMPNICTVFAKIMINSYTLNL